MQKEIKSLKENRTWDLVDRPKHTKVLSNRWVFKVKQKQNGTIDKFKARLVARGNEQREGIDYEEVFAPVARLATIRTMLAIAVSKKMHVHQMDVVTAYVQGKLTDIIYMEQPEMFEENIGTDKVCKLNKPLYGLKQAGKEWYKTLDKYLTSIGLRKTPVNPCVYTDPKGKSDIIIIIYVDDILLASKDLDELTKTKHLLKSRFKINDLGEVKDILGMHVERKESTDKIKLSQHKYIKETLHKFNMQNCKKAYTPLIPNEKLRKERTRTELNMPYRELIGALTYLSNATRPDISYAANTLSQFNQNPSSYHWKAAKHVLRYLQATIHNGIIYDGSTEKLQIYTDSDFAADEEKRVSRSAYVSMLAGGPISWESKKQKSVSLSTMEAEYVALSGGAREAIYLKGLLTHMNSSSFVTDKIDILCDNQSAIHLSKNSAFHDKAKHIDICYHFTRQVQERGVINVQYVNTNNNIADILTKSLQTNKHKNCMNLLNIK